MSNARSNAISISTDTLKEVMPELQTRIESQDNTVGNGELSSLANDAVLVDSDEEGRVVDMHSNDAEKSSVAVTKDSATLISAVAKRRKRSRNSVTEPVVISSDEESINGMADNNDIAIIKKVVLPVEDPVRVKQKLSPARNSINATIHIQNLVRPYTIGQLRELLSKHGALSQREGTFWIDKVKSHCYATFVNADSAEAARKELHGAKWPSSNPKILNVEFASLDEIKFHKQRELAKLEGIPLESQRRQAESDARKKAELAAERQRLEKDKEERKTTAAAKERELERAEEIEKRVVREWDKNKLRQSRSPPPSSRRERRGSDRGENSREDHHSRSRDTGLQLSQRRGKQPPEAEPPVKMLDDLFKKTAALPGIYWLPLTDEQIATRKKKTEEAANEFARQREARKKERESRLAAEAKEKQRKADERRREIEQRARKYSEDRNRSRRGRRSRSRSNRRQSRSPQPSHRSRRGGRSSSSSSSSSSCSRDGSGLRARGSPSPKRPARGSPSPRRPAAEQRSPSPVAQELRSEGSADCKVAVSKRSASRDSSASPPPCRKRSAASSSSGSSSGASSSDSGSNGE